MFTTHIPIRVWILTRILLLVAATSMFSCRSSVKGTGYDYSRPDAVYALPDALREVSGVAVIDSTSVACVQDENGIIFVCDLVRKAVMQQVNFHSDGDYEDIAIVGRTAFVLRSDGTLFEVPDFSSGTASTVVHRTSIPANNNEGLCYDPEGKRLLLACKSNIGKGKEYRNIRAIYSFSLDFKLLSEDPVFEFNLETVKQFMTTHDVRLPVQRTKKPDDAGLGLKFRVSGIAVHPITRQIFLLSAVDHVLFAIDRAGKLECVEPLAPDLFSQPEGISFFPNGDMLITNEGHKRVPTLLLFKYRGPKR